MATKKKTRQLSYKSPLLTFSGSRSISLATPRSSATLGAKKAKFMMLNKQLKNAAAAKEVRYPWAEFVDSLYWLTEKPNLVGMPDKEAKNVLAEIIPQSKFGFPVMAFKKAALDAGFQQGALVRNSGTNDLVKTTVRGAFFVEGEFAVIEGIPSLHEAIGRLNRGGTEVRFRAEFKTWQTKLNIKFNANVITPAQMVNLFQLAGFSNGIGDWRPAKDGTYGTFHVET